MNNHVSCSTHKTRGRPKTVDPKHIINVAMNRYWNDSPVDVSINSICQTAKVSKPSLYREFKNEDGLMRAALDSYTELIISKLIEALQAQEGLKKTLDLLKTSMCDDPRMKKGCLFYKMRYKKDKLGALTRKKVDEIDQQIQEAFYTFLHYHQSTGEYKINLSIELGAKYLSEQIAFTAYQRALGEDPKVISQLLSISFSSFTS